jgi:hypothetical protein
VAQPLLEEKKNKQDARPVFKTVNLYKNLNNEKQFAIKPNGP